MVGLDEGIEKALPKKQKTVGRAVICDPPAAPGLLQLRRRRFKGRPLVRKQKEALPHGKASPY